MIQFVLIVIGMLGSYFLKEASFLGLNFTFLHLGEIRPDFLLMFIVFFSLYKGELAGIWIGFFAGLLEDSVNWAFDSKEDTFFPIIGIYSFVYSLFGYILAKVRYFFDRHRSIFTMLLILIASIATRFLIWTFQGILDNFNKNYAIIGPAIYTALLAPIWFTLLSFVYQITKKE